MKTQVSKNSLFISYYSGHALLAALSTCYAQVEREQAVMEELLQELKARRGERLDVGRACLEVKKPLDNIIILISERLDTGKASSEALFLERERAYEVVALRLKLSCDSFLLSVRELMAAEEAVDRGLRGEEFGVLLDVGIAQNNVLCARELLEAATALYFDTLHRQIYSYYRGTGTAIEKLYDARKADSDGRAFVVKSNYNDSRYRYDGGDGSTPPAGPHMTFVEASIAAEQWIGYSNGVGDAVIENLSTGQFYTFDGRPVQGEF